jgi:hypothetical protein
MQLSSQDDIDVLESVMVGEHIQREIISREKGHLAFIVAESDRWMSMMLVSTMDHICEPRDVEDYYIRASNATSDYWVLLWGRDGSEGLLLGQTTNKEGAERLLEYLKACGASQDN